MVLMAAALDVEALSTQTRLGRSALRDDLMSFGVLANTDAELKAICKWLKANCHEEWPKWREAFVRLRRNRVHPARAWLEAPAASLLPMSGLNTSYITVKARVGELAAELGHSRQSAVVRSGNRGSARAEVVAIDHFRDAPLVQETVSSHSSTLRKGAHRDEVWQRLRPLFTLADVIVIRDRYALRLGATRGDESLRWIAQQSAALPKRDRELRVYWTATPDEVTESSQLHALEQSLSADSEGSFENVHLIPVTPLSSSGLSQRNREVVHRVPHDRVFRFSTFDEQWSRRVVIGNSLRALEMPRLQDDLTFAYKALSTPEVEEERRIEHELLRARITCVDAVGGLDGRPA